eukprot:364962-Chlamydomonas_euryale.AAC.6
MHPQQQLRGRAVERDRAGGQPRRGSACQQRRQQRVPQPRSHAGAVAASPAAVAASPAAVAASPAAADVTTAAAAVTTAAAAASSRDSAGAAAASVTRHVGAAQRRTMVRIQLFIAAVVQLAAARLIFARQNVARAPHHVCQRQQRRRSAARVHACTHMRRCCERSAQCGRGGALGSHRARYRTRPWPACAARRRTRRQQVWRRVAKARLHIESRSLRKR